MAEVDLRTHVGNVELKNPVLTASGTSGHGAELEAYFPLAALGAVTVKSLSVEPWDGNAAPRVHQATAGMLNSVGLQGPGIAAWLGDDLPRLQRCGASVVASIWGRTVDEYAAAAAALRGSASAIVAVEVNLSCPNLDGGRHLFAHSAADTSAVVAAVVAELDRPAWAKLSAQVTDLVAIAEAAMGAGTAALTLVNTLPGMAIDVDTRSFRLGSGANGGGLSGPAMHPIAVRAVHDVHAALPAAPIVGVGGVATGEDAIELLLAGASAVQVGTATFADPRASHRVLDEVARWCTQQGVATIGELIGGVHV
ncbi:MAG: dihydroorotate dehydrogenase [Acidimicrobiales bacterium]